MAKQGPGLVNTQYDDLTYQVNGLAMQVHDELKPGHPEKFYQRRLANLCQESGLEVEIEKRVEVFVDDSMIGYLKLDLWIEGILVVECKALSHPLTNDEIGQVLTYLAATSSPIGMLYNFGRSRLGMKRIFPSQTIRDWQKYLYRVLHRNKGMKLPPLPELETLQKTSSNSVPPIRFKSVGQKPSHIEIPSPGGAALRLSVLRQPSVDQPPSSQPSNDTESSSSKVPNIRLSVLRQPSVDQPPSSQPSNDTGYSSSKVPNIRLSVLRQPSVDQSSYAQAGVSIDAGNRAVELMKSKVNATHGSEVLAGIGSFGGLFSATTIKDMTNPVLVASTDGVGTKVMLAAQTGRYSGIGMDIVNHCINDILVQGARPLFFMDYFASSKIVPEIVAEVVGGMASACQAAGCALLGGETAEMPGVYGENHFDVAGTIIGVVDRSEILPKEGIQPGDVLVGLRSSGPHTNGYSLLRQVFAGIPLDQEFPELGGPLANAVLEPHRSYLQALQPALDVGIPKGLAHITGGGFFDNIPRILPQGCGAAIHRDSWPVPPLFQLIQKRGEVDPVEMYRVFNMGIGMVAVLSMDQLTDFQSAIREETWVIGEVTAGPGVRLA